MSHVVERAAAVLRADSYTGRLIKPNAPAMRDTEPTCTHTFVTSPSEVMYKLMTANHDAREHNMGT